MEELAAQMLVLVQNGMPIKKAAIRVYGYAVYYYRMTTDSERAVILRARREFVSSQQIASETRLVNKRIPMPASRRKKLQEICDNRKEPVNTVANRLFNLLIKYPNLFEMDLANCNPLR